MEVVSYGNRVLFSVSPSLPARVTALVPYELLLRGSKTTFVKINNTLVLAFRIPKIGICTSSDRRP